MRCAVSASWLKPLTTSLLVVGHLILAFAARLHAFSSAFHEWGFADFLLIAQGFLILCAAVFSPRAIWFRAFVAIAGILAIVIIHNPSPLLRYLFFATMAFSAISLTIVRRIGFSLV